MSIRNNHRIIAFLGKVFFPGKAPWQQRTNVLTVLWAIVAGVLTGGAIVGFMLLRGTP